jgi:hypothetical protein
MQHVRLAQAFRRSSQSKLGSRTRYHERGQGSQVREGASESIAVSSGTVASQCILLLDVFGRVEII